MAAATNIYAGRVRHQEDGLPKRQNVKLGATVAVGIGGLVVTVAGYGALPAAANAATGKCAGVALANVDNTSGAAGDLSVGCEDGTYDFKNDVTHPCTQADVGLKVYASDRETISNNSADGPLVGKLVEFNPADREVGRPCRVRLNVDNIT